MKIATAIRGPILGGVQDWIRRAMAGDPVIWLVLLTIATLIIAVMAYRLYRSIDTSGITDPEDDLSTEQREMIDRFDA